MTEIKFRTSRETPLLNLVGERDHRRHGPAKCLRCGAHLLTEARERVHKQFRDGHPIHPADIRIEVNYNRVIGLCEDCQEVVGTAIIEHLVLDQEGEGAYAGENAVSLLMRVLYVDRDIKPSDYKPEPGGNSKE